MAAGDIPATILDDGKGRGKLPPERFSSANDLRGYCQELIREDDKRVALRARIENLFNGFPSYPRGQVTPGMSWLPRVNYRELEGWMSSQSTPLYDLVVEVDHCIEIELDIEAESSDQRDQWERDIAKNVTWLWLKRWRQGFNYNLLLSQREMLLHGIGSHVNIDKNWRIRTPRAGELLFPKGTPLNFNEDGKLFMLRNFVAGEDVYQWIRNEDVAAKRGWVPDNVWATLAKAGKRDRKEYGYNDTLELQRRFRRGDLGYANSSQVGLWFNWVFVTEYEGGISIYGIEENINAGRGALENGYLFRKRFALDEFPLTTFMFDIGNGDIDSVRGMGVRGKDFFELSNRMKNAMVAQVLISAFPQIKQTQPNIDPDKLKLMRINAMSIIPYGADYGLMNFPPLANGGLALSKELKETLAENNQSLSTGSPEPRDRETATSFSMRAQDAARISNGLQSLYESNLQHLYERMYRLLITTPSGNLPHQKLAKEFRERCKRDGIPDAALREDAIGEIREVTSVGAGSAAQRFHALMTLWQLIYPEANETEKITIRRDMVSNLMGYARVNRYTHTAQEVELPDQDDSIATLESSTLAQGGDAQISTTQNDTKHAVNHMQQASQLMAAAQNGELDPMQAFRGISKLLNHTGEHLAKLQNIPSRQAEFKQLEEEWNQLKSDAQELLQMAEEQQGQQEQMQGASEDSHRKDMIAQADIQRKDTKAQADMARQFRKDTFKMRMNDATTAVKISQNGAARRR